MDRLLMAVAYLTVLAMFAAGVAAAVCFGEIRLP
jgi:hypothetical protein